MTKLPTYVCAYSTPSVLITIRSNIPTEIIFRKSDVRKKGLTRGWELTLSHDVKNGITTGFCKGTASSDIVECIKHLKACGPQIGHPLLLPIIIFSHDVSFKTDIKQREARDWLRRLEHAVSMRSEIEEKEGYVDDGVVDLDAVNRDLVECHSQVLWKRPIAYLQILDGIERAMERFWEKLPEHRMENDMRKLQASMIARLDFYRVKLQGLDSYAFTTLQRLDIQRSAVWPSPLFLPYFMTVLLTDTTSSSTTSSPKRNPSSTSKWPANSASSPTPVNGIQQP